MRRQTRFLSRTLFAGVVLATLTLAGCGEDSSTSSNKGPVVSTTKPAGWTLRENYPIAPGLAADYVYAAPPVGGFSANVLLVTTPSSGEVPAAVVNNEIETMRSNPAITGLVVDSNSSIKVGGKDAHRVQLRYIQVVNGGSFDLFQRQILLVHNGKLCQLVLTRLQPDSVASAAFRGVEASIRLN